MALSSYQLLQVFFFDLDRIAKVSAFDLNVDGRVREVFSLLVM